MNNYLQPYYQDPKIRKQHTKNAEIYNTLTSITNKKEQQFFAYFLTHIQTLQELYKTLTILRDIDETLCHRLKPEDDRHYDVIRPGIKTLMSYLKQEQETITNGILSVRGQEFLDETFIANTNSDRHGLSDHFDTNHIYSSKGYPSENSLGVYHNTKWISERQHNKAHAYHDITTKKPKQKFILIDDIIAHQKGSTIYQDRHIPFPMELLMTEYDAIFQNK